MAGAGVETLVDLRKVLSNLLAESGKGQSVAIPNGGSGEGGGGG